jgi:aminopeptidase
MLRDPRLDALAHVLVNYSLEVRPGHLVLIQMNTVAAPLAEAATRAVLDAGAHPSVCLLPDNLAEILMEHGSEEQLSHTNPFRLHEVEHADRRLAAWAETNTRGQSNFDPRKAALLSKGRRPIMETVMRRSAKEDLLWVGTQYPTDAHAQDAEMSTAAYADFVFKAGLLDQPDPAAAWRKLGQAQQRVVDFIHDQIAKGKTEYEVTAGNGTKLTMDLAGRTWINCDGKANFPDGEVFSAPVDGTTNGTIRYSFPAVHAGRECDGIELTFREGVCVDAKADKGLDFLLAMLDQDDGARRFGECAIGTNYGITRYTKNTLFDEKIGGTVHFAVGEAYPETGGTNKSGLHWDMVCDLRPDAGGGEIKIGGETISKDGRFTRDGWPGR